MMLGYQSALWCFVILSLACGLFMLLVDLRIYEWLGQQKELKYTRFLAWANLVFSAASASFLVVLRLIG